MAKAGLCNIYLVAPTTPDPRMEFIVKRGRGFIYYVSREGVTGMQQTVAGSIREKLARIRAYTNLPIAVGFGISTPDQARDVSQFADAVVVGSAIVNQIAQHGSAPDAVQRISDFVKTMVDAAKGK
jgi:tryptophan synthase alpha chain